MVMRVLVCVALVMAMAVTEAQKVFTTYGSSGQLCGNPAVRCLVGVPCVDGKCTCPSDRPVGNGQFACLSAKTDLCTFKNDPILKSFDGSHVDVPIMNKVLLAHVETRKCPMKRMSGISLLTGMGRGDGTECDVRAFTFGHRLKGKMFVKGVELKIMINRRGKTYNHAVRINAGMDHEGHHTFLEEGSKGFMGSGPYRNPIVTRLSGGSNIQTKYDKDNNFARVASEECGVSVGIRGLDFSGDVDFHTQEPGVYVAVDQECDAKYMSTQRTLCAGPRGSLNTLRDQVVKMEADTGRHVTPHTLMMVKALNSDPFPDFQTSRRASSMLYSLAETSLECDPPLLVDAVNNCTFIFSNANFHKCYDSEEDDAKAITLYNNCLFAVCDYNHGMCRRVKKDIKDSNCKPAHIDVKQTIIHHSCDF